MQVSVETTQGLERQVTITVPAEVISKDVDARLRQLAKTQRIHGFRPGKVPVKVIQQRYGAAVAQDVAGDVMQKSFVEAIVAQKLNPAGTPALTPSPIKIGEDFTFVAKFEIYPEVAVQNLDKIAIEKPTCDILESELDEMVETLQKQHASWDQVEREATDGDKLDINFIGKVDGEEFDGGQAENFALELGTGRMIPGFEEGVIGHKAGEQFTIDVNFPDEYHAEHLKGKAAQFDITVNKVEAKTLPELNEEFFKLFAPKELTLESLKVDVKANMQRELDQAVKANIKEQALNGLVDNNELEVPAALITGEIEQLKKQAVERFNQYNSDNQPDLPDEIFKDQAERRVKIGLLLGEVIKLNKIEVDDTRLDSTIETMAASYEDPAQVVEYYKNNEDMLNNIRNIVVEDQAVDYILDQANLSDKVVEFSEFMKQGEAKA